MHPSPALSSRVSCVPANFLYLMKNDAQDLVVPILIMFATFWSTNCQSVTCQTPQPVSNFMSFYLYFVPIVNRKHYCVVEDDSLGKKKKKNHLTDWWLGGKYKAFNENRFLRKALRMLHLDEIAFFGRFIPGICVKWSIILIWNSQFKHVCALFFFAGSVAAVWLYPSRENCDGAGR